MLYCRRWKKVDSTYYCSRLKYILRKKKRKKKKNRKLHSKLHGYWYRGGHACMHILWSLINSGSVLNSDGGVDTKAASQLVIYKGYWSIIDRMEKHVSTGARA